MWEVRTYYKDLTGGRKQKTKRGFAKKSEALEWERNFKLKENQSISMSFKSFVDIYLTDLEPRIKRNMFLTKKHNMRPRFYHISGKGNWMIFVLRTLSSGKMRLKTEKG